MNPFEGINPRVVGLEDCGSLFTLLETKKMIAEGYLVRHFLSIQHGVEAGDLGDEYQPPGTDSPADGLTRVRIDMVPLPRLLESGRFRPGQLRPPKGVARKAKGSHVTKSNSICTRTRRAKSCVGRVTWKTCAYLVLRGPPALPWRLVPRPRLLACFFSL